MNIIENNDFGPQGFSGRLKETQEAQAGSREAPGSSRRLKSSISPGLSRELRLYLAWDPGRAYPSHSSAEMAPETTKTDGFRSPQAQASEPGTRA